MKGKIDQCGFLHIQRNGEYVYCDCIYSTLAKGKLCSTKCVMFGKPVQKYVHTTTSTKNGSKRAKQLAKEIESEPDVTSRVDIHNFGWPIGHLLSYHVLGKIELPICQGKVLEFDKLQIIEKK